MQLKAKHRECLLVELTESKDKLEHLKDVFLSSKDEEMLSFYEIKLFLIREQIKTIEQSLINNEIDF